MTAPSFPPISAHPPLTPESEAIVQEAASKFVTPDLNVARYVVGSIDAAFARAKLARDAREHAEQEARRREIATALMRDRGAALRSAAE